MEKASIAKPSHMLVSVIICFYNDERYLAEAIRSVLTQTYTNYELLLVDDGSSDESSMIAKRFVSSDPNRLKYLHHAGRVNKGLSESRNLGISHARGEFVTFLDSDDVYLPAYLANQVSLMSKHPDVSMVIEATEYWHSWKQVFETDRIIQIGAPQDLVYTPPELALQLYPLGKGDAPCTCGTIIRKQTLDKHGGFEPKFTGMYEDQAFFIKIYLHEKVFISSSCNNRYRQRPESMMTNANREGKYHQYRKMFLEWLEAYLKNTHYQNPKIKTLHSARYFRYRFPLFYRISRYLARTNARVAQKFFHR